MSNLWQDLRYAVRVLAKSPGFTATVVLSLALGIGANTAIFSLIDAVMLKSLPVRNPEELVLLSWSAQQWPDFVKSASGDFNQDKTGRLTSTAFSYPTFKDLQANRGVFADAFAFTSTGKVNLNADGQAQLAEGELASGDYFSGLGIKAAAGRLLTDFDDKSDSLAAAVISYGYWERRFGRRLSVVGQAITINGVPFTIVGIAPPEFFGLSPGTALDVWMPLRTQPLVNPSRTEKGLSKFLWRGDWWLQVMGRLQPGVNQQRAMAQLNVVFRHGVIDPGAQSPQLDQPKSAQPEPNLALVPGGKGLRSLRDEFSKPLFILMTVVSLVLLIACANVANLLLSRATSRHKEIAVRMAVGAARRRLIRQLLTESTLLAAVGGLLGLLLAYVATRFLITLMSSGRESIAPSVRPDLSVLGFTAAVSLLTGIFFGLAPALRGTRLDLTSALKEDSKGSASKHRHTRIELGRALVVAQVAISLLLLVGAGLFVRTLVNLENVDTGFDRRDVLLFDVDPTQNGYQGERLSEFYQELRRRIEVLPGVKSATFSTLALTSDGLETRIFSVEGDPVDRTQLGPRQVDENDVGPRFFETMGIPVLLGRPINQGDLIGAPKIAVVNETLARKYFGSSSPIGRRFDLGIGKAYPDIEIVGVVADTKYEDLRTETAPTVFVPLSQNPNLATVTYGAVTFEARSLGNPNDLIPAIRHAVNSLDQNMPISNVRTQVEQIDQTLFQERLFAKLSGFFGLLASLLACIGMYGIMSYAVGRRTNEIGIRMALGARQQDILRKVMQEAFVLVSMGVAIGIPIALGALRLISSMLFGLKPTDPITLATAIVFILGVSAFASYIPARRAAKVDPMVALRYE